MRVSIDRMNLKQVSLVLCQTVKCLLNSARQYLVNDIDHYQRVLLIVKEG